MINPPTIYLYTKISHNIIIETWLKKYKTKIWWLKKLRASLHCKGGICCGGGSSGSVVDGGEPKSILGKTPGGLSRGSMESNWLESPTTSAHP